MSAKILVLDIETAPTKVYTWGLYDQNIGINQIIQDSYMLSWSAKWYDNDTVMHDALINHKTLFKKDPTNEIGIAKSIWKLLDEADICIAHNGDQFDLKWLNTVFLRVGLQPPSSFKSIDTLKETRGNFRHISNKLDYLCSRLAIGHKLKHEGFDLWVKCMKGDVKAWARMIHYNKKDVVLLQELYDFIKPFMKSHPNLALYQDNDSLSCPVCSGTEFQKKGYSYTSTNKYQRYKCKGCGKSVRDRTGLITQKSTKQIVNPRG